MKNKTTAEILNEGLLKFFKTYDTTHVLFNAQEVLTRKLPHDNPQTEKKLSDIRNHFETVNPASFAQEMEVKYPNLIEKISEADEFEERKRNYNNFLNEYISIYGTYPLFD